MSTACSSPTIGYQSIVNVIIPKTKKKISTLLFNKKKFRFHLKNKRRHLKKQQINVNNNLDFSISDKQNTDSKKKCTSIIRKSPFSPTNMSKSGLFPFQKEAVGSNDVFKHGIFLSERRSWMLTENNTETPNDIQNDVHAKNDAIIEKIHKLLQAVIDSNLLHIGSPCPNCLTSDESSHEKDEITAEDYTVHDSSASIMKNMYSPYNDGTPNNSRSSTAEASARNEEDFDLEYISEMRRIIHWRSVILKYEETHSSPKKLEKYYRESNSVPFSLKTFCEKTKKRENTELKKSKLLGSDTITLNSRKFMNKISRLLHAKHELDISKKIQGHKEEEKKRTRFLCTKGYIELDYNYDTHPKKDETNFYVQDKQLVLNFSINPKIRDYDNEYADVNKDDQVLYATSKEQEERMRQLSNQLGKNERARNFPVRVSSSLSTGDHSDKDLDTSTTTTTTIDGKERNESLLMTEIANDMTKFLDTKSAQSMYSLSNKLIT